ncbi:MAG TPA: choice-of-anchor D domain-containing protein [Terracidiphilus sp.]|nr:choice-of-anchor D domain-containing protein [Terracidiphilus sp.]
MRGPLHGNDTFGRVRYSGIYPGIDAVFYGNDQQLEFDMVMAPHANPKLIRLAFSGANRMRLTKTGEIAFELGTEEILLRKPSIYQERNGVRTKIAGTYALRGKSEVGLRLAAYDQDLPLTIDPTIEFATYLGGPGTESAVAVKVSRLGDIYVASSSDSVTSIPATQQFPIETPQSGFSECFLTKLSADGSQELYTVIFNGVRCEAMDIQPGLVHLSMGKSGNYLRTLREDASGQPSSLDLLQGAYDFNFGPVEELRADSAGNIYVVAFYQPSGSPNPIYELQKIDANGQLLGTIPLINAAINQPGNIIYEQVTGLDIDDHDNAYVVGIDRLNNVITPTANAFQSVKPSNGADDAFLLRVNTGDPGAFQIDYATFLGGSSDDEARQVAFDSATGTVLIAGDTSSSNFPTTPGSPGFSNTSGFLTKLDLSRPASSQLVGSVLMGSSYSTLNLLTVLPGGIPTVTGTAFDTGFLLINPIYPAQSTSYTRPFLRTYTPDLLQATFSTFLDKVPGNTFVAAVAANGTQSLYVAVDTNDGSLGTQGAFHSNGLGGYDVLLRALDVSSVVPADQPPAISFTPANLSLSIIQPGQPVAFPLVCGQLFQCNIQDPDGDALTDFAWYGSNGYRLEQTNSTTGVPPSGSLSLAPGTYLFTLKVRDTRGAIGSGTLTVNVLAQNTFQNPNPETIQLTDELFDSPDSVYKGNVHPATITFPAVLADGLTWLQSRSDQNPPIPPGLQAGSPPYYYDVHTTAAFSEPATLCVDRTGMSFADPNNVRLYELESDVWTPLSASAQGNSLCADTSLPNTNGGDRSTTVAFFYPQVPATAITAIAGTGYGEGSIDGPGGDPRDDAPNGVPPLQSALSRPASLAFNPSSRQLLVSESGSTGAIRRIDLNTNLISLVAPYGQAVGSAPLATDPSGSFLYYVAPVDSSGAEEIVRMSLFNGAASVIAGGASCCSGPGPVSGQPAASSYLAGVNSLLVDFAGNLFVTRDGSADVYRINSADGNWALVLSENPHSTSGVPITPYLDFPRVLAFDNQGYLLAGGQILVRVSPGPDGTVDGSSSSTASVVGGIPAANMTGYAQPFAGDGLPATQAALFISYAMFVDQNGGVIFDDGITHRVRRIDPGADGIVNGDSDEIVQTIASYYSFTAPPPSNFATSSYGDFRGLVQDPLNNTIYAASYTGNQVFAIGTSVTAPANTAPRALSVSISGNPQLGQQLTGQYVYYDADGDREGTSTFRWLRDGVAISGATSTTYTVVAADTGHTLVFEVTPVAATGISPGTAVQSSGMAILNFAPVAANVSISGTPKVGSLLTGTYSYSDAEGDAEGASQFQWFRDSSLILGATAISYTAAPGDAGHSISFQVTPVALSGTTPGKAVKSAPVNIVQAPAFTSGTSATFVVGSLGTFTFVASGSPAPTFSISPALPSGLSLNTATGVLSGTPAAGNGGVHTVTVTASNGVSPDATQSFTLIIDEAPSFTSAYTAAFTVGVPGSFQITASGYPAPVISETTALPTGITFNPATQILAGTPAVGTAQLRPYTLNFTATNSAGTSSQGLDLSIQQPPAITSANSSTFQLGAHGTSTITATGFPLPTVSVAGTPPSGITITTTPGQALIGGTPAPNTQGTYSFTATVDNGVGTPATQTYTLTVSSAAVPTYSVASLGLQCSGPSGFFCSEGLGINNNGQVVGEAWTGTNLAGFFVPFISSPPYDSPQLLTMTGMGDAVSVNNEGQLTGSFAVGGDTSFHAFLSSSPYNSFTDLGDPGGGLIIGYGINNSRQISGAANFAPNSAVHAFLWDGTMHDIGTLNGDSTSDGYGINASGQIAGTSESQSSISHAFLYTPANGAVPSSMINLGDLGGGSSQGLAINNSSQVTGTASLPNGLNPAFLWDGTMHDIGSLEGGYAEGKGINNLGQITGISEIAGGQSRAFLYTPANEMLDLNTLIPSNSGWTLLYAFAINDAGQITGSGIDPNGNRNAFVLTPTGPPVAGGATVSGGSVHKPSSGTANIAFTVTVNNNTTAPFAVNFTTADGTAVAGADYIANAGTLTFAPGITSQTIPVQIIGGAPNRSNLFFSLQVRNGGNGNLLAIGAGTIQAPPTQIVYSISASPQSLALIASATKSSAVTLKSENGVSETAQLSAAWNGTSPSGVTFTLSSSNVSIPPAASDSASATLSVTTTSSPSPGTFTLRVTSKSASGVTNFVDVSIVVAASLPASTCGCTKTGAFVSPSVKALVAPTINPGDPNTGVGPGGFATVTTSSNQLTLTRNSDHKTIISSETNISAFGFSPNGELFVLITQPQPGNFALNLYSIPTGGLVSRSNPLTTNPLSWGFSPDADNRYFVVTSSTSLPTHLDINIYDMQTGATAMSTTLTNYSSFGPPPWSDETDVDDNDGPSNADNQVGGWGFSPDGNTFVLSYKTDLSTYALSLWNLPLNSRAPVIGDWPVRDVASFWQFSPCSDLFMWVHQQGANPSLTDPVDFLFTSNGRSYQEPTLVPSQGAPSANVVTNPDGSKEIQLIAMSLGSIASPQCSVSVTAHSPVNITMSDASGLRTGFDINTGGAVNQIPGGSYTGVGSEPQTVAVPFAAGGYVLDAYGLASLTSPEPYTLTFAEFDASGDVVDQSDFTGMATQGLDQRFAFTVGNGPIQPSPMAVAPTVTFTGAPATAIYHSAFTVAATTNASTAASIVAVGSCSIVGNLVTITSGAGTCNLTASWPADSHYLAATASQSTVAMKAGSTAAILSNTPNPSAPGQAVAVTFQVTGNGSPSGVVSVTANTGETCTSTLTASNGSCSITFVAAGAKTLIANYAGDANFNGSVSAGIAQLVNGTTVSFSPASVNFGNVYLGLPAAQIVTLSNLGNVPMSIGRIQVTGGNDSDDFLALSLCPPTLAAGKSCKITVGFLADSDNYNPTAVLRIYDSASDSPQSLPLSATVINPKASLSSYSLAFGKQKIGAPGTVQAVKLTNSGTTPLIMSSVSINGDFTLASGTTCANGSTLTAGASCMINVTFVPTTKGTRLGSVTIRDNALINQQIILLSGTGD